MCLFYKVLKQNNLKSFCFHVLCHSICNLDCTTPDKSTCLWFEISRNERVISPRWEWKVVSRFFLFVCQMSHENARMLSPTTDAWWWFHKFFWANGLFLNLVWPFLGLKFENLEIETSVSVRNWELKPWFENPDTWLLSKK